MRKIGTYYMNFNKLAFGKRISKARNNMKLTQEEMADKCFISVSHVRSLESGAKSPSCTLIVTICNVLHVSPDDLFQDSIIKTKCNECSKLEGHMKLLDEKHLRLANDVFSTFVEFLDNN